MKSTDLGFSAIDKGISSDPQRLPDRPGTLGRDTQLLKQPHGVMCEELTGLARAPAGEVVPHCLGFAEVTLERVVPGYVVGPVRQILFVLNLKADSLESLSSVRDRAHLGDTVADFDAVSKLLVLGNGWVPVFGHDPLVNTKDSSGLQDLEDLAIDTLK